MNIDHRIYSCDDHLDIYNLPRDLWTERLPEKYREAGPHVEERGGMHLWFAGDRVMGPSGSLPGIDTAIDRAGVEDDGFRASNPVLRMQDMERDGIHASIVYGPGTLFGNFQPIFEDTGRGAGESEPRIWLRRTPQSLSARSGRKLRR